MGELKVLVLGDGLLGSEIVKQTGWDFISRKKDGFDINNMIELFRYNNNPTVIINCIANTDTYSEDRDSHWKTNYEFVNKLIKYCNDLKIKLVHISTDYLYADSVENASEKDIPMPCKNWYGYTKLLADGLVQLESNNYLICRCTHKPRPFPYDNAWTNQLGNFDYVDVIAGLIIKMVKNDLVGVYNVGTETKSMYELAKQTKDVGKSLAPDYIPKNTSMDIRKLKQNLEKPFFSIAIPAYGYNGKGAEFLIFNLDILKKQTFKNFEVVISDHSIDNTIKDILSLYNESELNIRYIRNEKGRGFISPNLNIAIKGCSGKWIKILFQDDFLYDEESLQVQADELESKPNIKWAMTDFCHSNTGYDFYRYYYPTWNDSIWTGNNTMGCPSGLTLRNEEVILFDETLNWLVDVDYYKKMFDKHGEPFIIKCLTYVNRTHGTGLSSTTPMEVKQKEHKIVNARYA